jgi:hypothetical protein
MEGYWIVLLTVLGVVILGSLIQTFQLMPTFFDRYFDKTASTITACAILLFISVVVLQELLQALSRWNREGFQNQEPEAMKQWKEMIQTYQVKEVCSVKQQIMEKLIPVEKQANTLTDQQAKERVEKQFSEGTSNGTVNCGFVDRVTQAKDIDSFFTEIQLVPNTFLIQVQDTAQKSTQLLQKQYDDVMKSLKKEGFVDPSVGICSPEITEERRKFLREKKLDEEAQRCLLPEEVPFEKKETVALDKVKKLQSTYDAYLRLGKSKAPLMSDLVTTSQDLLKKLDDLKKKAESGEILKELALKE